MYHFFKCLSVESNGSFTLSNGLLEAQISAEGQVLSLKVAGNSRDLLEDTAPKFGNKITLFDDEPLYWDAWDIMDYHLETGKTLNSAGVSKNVFIQIEKFSTPSAYLV